ncbi:bifunctional phosphopantothenoylcysteine decarboxylase/phosphopantothenate--cysteine ligase CoaBC [Desulfuribacillus alkaliarsenatis]|nr:bifunctional phosphopantothenoylcysteine decarboxylase/phosphopantothenate--cysteine ligase CoaBC [Desulfuribacillus alkaliarsenatis]
MSKIVIGITGGIASYKIANICSKLRQNGHEVRVMMTKSATEFITPLTFQSLTNHPVIVDMFEKPEAGVSHIEWADWADIVLVAPATANILGKVSNGIADDFVSTIVMATKASVVFAPAMNVNMYDNPIVQNNIATLRQYGYHFIEPEEGYLACGYTGKGRLANDETILSTVEFMINSEANNHLNLSGKNILITAGPTREAIDPVRYLTNHSSGKMGYALAEAAVRYGASVTLISGPTSLDKPSGVNLIKVTNAQEMLDAVLQELSNSDLLIKAAAVADYRPKKVAEHKIKKHDDSLTIELQKNTDILTEVSKHRSAKQIIVGFAAESENLLVNAKKKLQTKKLDFIIANDISKSNSGFDVDYNQVIICNKDGSIKELPKLHKKQLAVEILKEITNS